MPHKGSPKKPRGSPAARKAKQAERGQRKKAQRNHHLALTQQSDGSAAATSRAESPIDIDDCHDLALELDVALANVNAADEQHEMYDLVSHALASPVSTGATLLGPAHYEAQSEQELFGPCTGMELWGSMQHEEFQMGGIGSGEYDYLFDSEGGSDLAPAEAQFGQSRHDEWNPEFVADGNASSHIENGGGASGTVGNNDQVPAGARGWTPFEGDEFLDLHPHGHATTTPSDVPYNDGSIQHPGQAEQTINPQDTLRSLLTAEIVRMGSDVGQSVHPTHPQYSGYVPIDATRQVHSMFQRESLHTTPRPASNGTIDPTLLGIDENAAVPQTPQSSPGGVSRFREMAQQQHASILAKQPRTPRQRAEYRDVLANQTANVFIANGAKKVRRLKKVDRAAQRVKQQAAKEAGKGQSKTPSIAVLSVIDRREKRKVLGETYTPFQKKVLALVLQVPEGRLTTARAIASVLRTSSICVGRMINWYLDNIVIRNTPVFKVVKMNPLSGRLMPLNVNHRAECARHGFTYDRKGYFLGQNVFFNEFEFDVQLMQTAVENFEGF